MGDRRKNKDKELSAGREEVSVFSVSELQHVESHRSSEDQENSIEWRGLKFFLMLISFQNHPLTVTNLLNQFDKYNQMQGRAPW